LYACVIPVHELRKCVISVSKRCSGLIAGPNGSKPVTHDDVACSCGTCLHPASRERRPTQANATAAGPAQASSANVTTLLVVQQEHLTICPRPAIFVVLVGRCDERGEMSCMLHPYINVVGVCASCLRPLNARSRRGQQRRRWRLREQPQQPRKLTPHLPARRHHHHQQAEAAGGLFPRSVSSYVGASVAATTTRAARCGRRARTAELICSLVLIGTCSCC
jgi:hypothetical protein